MSNSVPKAALYYYKQSIWASVREPHRFSSMNPAHSRTDFTPYSSPYTVCKVPITLTLCRLIVLYDSEEKGYGSQDVDLKEVDLCEPLTPCPKGGYQLLIIIS